MGGCKGDVGGFLCLQNLNFSTPAMHAIIVLFLESLIPSSYRGGRKYHGC